jgi:hypothetical protein
MKEPACIYSICVHVWRKWVCQGGLGVLGRSPSLHSLGVRHLARDSCEVAPTTLIYAVENCNINKTMGASSLPRPAAACTAFMRAIIPRSRTEPFGGRGWRRQQHNPKSITTRLQAQATAFVHPQLELAAASCYGGAGLSTGLPTGLGNNTSRMQ